MRLNVKHRSAHYGKRIVFKVYSVPRLIAVGKEAKRGTYTKNYDNEKQKSSTTRSRTALERLIVHNLDTFGVSALVTYTFREHITELSEARMFFKLFLKRLRYYEDDESPYIAVTEFTKQGRVHFHVLHYGEWWFRMARNERKQRIIAKYWGYGYVDAKPLNFKKQDIWQ